MNRTLTALAALALLLVGCSSATTEPGAEEPTASPASEPAQPEQATEPAAEPTEMLDEVITDASENGTREDPLPIGGTGYVGDDWEITITAVNLDANAEVEAVEFNEPSEVGTYVLVTLQGTFLGNIEPEGQPWMDLTVVIVGNDAKQYTDTDTFATAPEDLSELPTLEAGATFEGQFVLSVPEDVLNGAHLFIEPLWDYGNIRVYWDLSG